MSSRMILLPIFVAIKLCNAFTPSNYQSIRYTSSSTSYHPTTTLQATTHDNNLFEDRTNNHNQFDRIGGSTPTSNDIDSVAT